MNTEITFEAWMDRYVDRIALKAELKRSEAAVIVADEEMDDFLRGWWEEGISPESAADEELESNWIDI